MIKRLISKLFWTTVLVGAIVMTGYVYYLKYPEVQESVDARLPMAKELNTKILAVLSHGNNPLRAPEPVPETPVQAVSKTAPTPVVVAAPVAKPVAGVAEVPRQPVPDTVDMAQLSQSRADWPKLVVLKKSVEFPAVLDGKMVGTVKAPAGTQVKLIMIKDSRVGVEYQGGGAMVDVANTDLIEQVTAARKKAVVTAVPDSPISQPVPGATPTGLPSQSYFGNTSPFGNPSPRDRVR
jgi:hypothetical protein